MRLVRAVNLPTVPGDLLVGAAAAWVSHGEGSGLTALALAAVASVFLYVFALVDNDIAGVATDVDRPIPEGQISLRAARIARGLSLGAVMVLGALGNLPPIWWLVVWVTAVLAVFYNRSKWSFIMGFCRALNVVAGAAAIGLTDSWPVAAVAAGWFIYITAITVYSTGEQLDPAKKKIVGGLIGALVYLQLSALVIFTLLNPANKPLLIAGAVLLVALRLGKRLMPGVSAS